VTIAAHSPRHLTSVPPRVTDEPDPESDVVMTGATPRLSAVGGPSPDGEAATMTGTQAGILADLVALARKGDRMAFEELVKATSTATYTLAYRLVGDEEDARDVVQEAYLRAYRGLKRFRGDAQFTTWLYRITANCAATQLGRRSRNRHEELSEDAPLIDSGRRGDPEDRADQGELREQLQEALIDLPPRLRAVVVLRDIYDLSHEAIAAELGISESAAKVRLHRARRKLRERLYPLVGDRRDEEVGEEAEARAL
jgi:RNA polymerase sigma-70 factor (ECF subfamily)